MLVALQTIHVFFELVDDELLLVGFDAQRCVVLPIAAERTDMANFNVKINYWKKLRSASIIHGAASWLLTVEALVAGRVGLRL